MRKTQKYVIVALHVSDLEHVYARGEGGEGDGGVRDPRTVGRHHVMVGALVLRFVSHTSDPRHAQPLNFATCSPQGSDSCAFHHALKVWRSGGLKVWSMESLPSSSRYAPAPIARSTSSTVIDICSFSTTTCSSCASSVPEPSSSAASNASRTSSEPLEANAEA